MPFVDESAMDCHRRMIQFEKEKIYEKITL